MVQWDESSAHASELLEQSRKLRQESDRLIQVAAAIRAAADLLRDQAAKTRRRLSEERGSA
jgi:hypothetical protein